jgi:hypothetical protein
MKDKVLEAKLVQVKIVTHPDQTGKHLVGLEPAEG